MNKETIEALRQIEKEKSIPFDAAHRGAGGRSPFRLPKDARTPSRSPRSRSTGRRARSTCSSSSSPRARSRSSRTRRPRSTPPWPSAQEITPEDFGRIAAQTAKQVIYQRIREAEQGIVFKEYSDRVGEIVTGIVQQSDSRYTLVDLGRVEARLPKSEQVPTERYEHGMRLKAVIKEVSQNPKEPPDHPVAAQRGAGAPAVRAGGSGDHPTGWSRSWAWPASRAIAPRSRWSRTATGWTRWAPAWARGARGCAWWCPSCGARRSTSSPSTRSRRASWPSRFRRPGCERCILDDEQLRGDGGGARRPAVAGHRQGRAERAPGQPADRLEDRHQVRDRDERGGHRVRGDRGGAGGGRRSLSRADGGRQALSQRGAAGQSILRHTGASGTRRRSEAAE